MSDESPYPQKGDTLFQGGLDHLNADISFWNKDLSGYAKGYKDSADFIVNGAIETENRAFGFQVPYLVFPVVFLYRQYIELRLKEVILFGTRLNNEKHAFPQHHRIDEIWKHARPYIQKWVSHEALDATETCVKEFCLMDPDGMAFRYPIDREGKPHLPEWTVINLRHLGETMEKIGNLLDGVTEVLYIDLQHKAEFREEW